MTSMPEPYRLRAARPVAAASAAETLGPVVRSFHRAAAGRHVGWVATPFVVLLGYFVWLARQGELSLWFNSGFSAFAVTALFVLVVVLIAYTAIGGGPEIVRLHADGLLDLRAGPRAVRWDEARSLTDLWDTRAGRLGGCVLRTADGAALVLGADVAGVEELVDELRARLTARELPAMLERLAEGGEVRFGAFVARAAGVAQGDRVLPWTAVGGPLVDKGELVLHDTSAAGATWASAPLRAVPNAFLLAELIEKRRAAAPALT
jgi:hypothetical protein